MSRKKPITIQDVFAQSYARQGKVMAPNHTFTDIENVTYLKPLDGFSVTGCLYEPPFHDGRKLDIFIPVKDMQYIIKRLVEIDDE